MNLVQRKLPTCEQQTQRKQRERERIESGRRIKGGIKSGKESGRARGGGDRERRVSGTESSPRGVEALAERTDTD